MMSTNESYSYALVGCGKAKQPLPESETVRAAELYTSTYFQLKWEYATLVADDIRILSAKHGLLHPDREIEAYDATLTPRSDAYIGEREHDEWAEDVESDLSDWIASSESNEAVVVLASDHYTRTPVDDFLEEHNAAYPLSDPSFDGVGDQNSWLKSQINMLVPDEQTTFSEFDM